ncbi:acetylornithine and succinylornithine aminotransferase [Alkaliphilus metalliredigens QYMF]|uniref:Acetylornithine aminotransferase n=1 Tax=Alkaliphilus metalliredigens (strain QYMF) TaxID=293826 RepID=A6TTJ0_ALKMQ|nr:acetylornithine transaminase [Alkaliphilus metalliredigens]ABR49508.1 acetylornithine and succinylornithine aminotransferase [Alkaliphilus metalliredigens QYMF]
MEIQKIINNGNQYLMSTYGRTPIAFLDGKGSTLTDTEGNEYLDMVAGLAVNSLGHSHPAVVEAIKNQAEKLLHTSNLYWIEGQVALAQKLVQNSFGDKVFFCNSGAEANEAAIKLARKYAYKKYGSHKNEIIAMTGSFHGRTLGTLSITNNPKYQEGYGPLPEGFKFSEFNNLEALKGVITENTCGIIIEPIQGEGGVTPVEATFLKAVKEICVKNDILLIFDEIQCGLGRTGKLFAYENYEIEPDIMTLAKALAGGVPIGAVIATDEVAKAWCPGDHGTTFGGNPLVCAVGLAVIDTILQEKLSDQAKQIGMYFAEKLQGFVNQYSWVKKVKGMGLILGLELEIEGTPIVAEAFKQGVLINCTAGKILRFLPPLIITEKEVDQTINTLAKIFKEMEGV